MKKLITSTLLMVLASISYGQDVVICSPSALTGGPDIVAELGICPRGYMEVRNNRITTVPSNPGGDFNRRMERMADSVRRDSEIRAAEREAARQREHEANLINQQIQSEQQAQRRATARLPEASRCLQGNWYIETKLPNRDVTSKLDVDDNGDIYWDGYNVSIFSNQDSRVSATLVNNNIYINHIYTSGNRLRISLSLSGQSLIGKSVGIGIKKGFFTDKELPPIESEMIGARLSATPSGCESDIEPSSNSRSSSPEVRGETIADGLRNLSELHEQGILTDEEFNAAKRRLLGL